MLAEVNGKPSPPLSGLPTPPASFFSFFLLWSCLVGRGTCCFHSHLGLTSSVPRRGSDTQDPATQLANLPVVILAAVAVSGSGGGQVPF